MRRYCKKGHTDWDLVKKQSEETIRKAARSDPEAPLLTRQELLNFKRVSSMKGLPEL